MLALLVAAIFAGVHRQGDTIRTGLRVVLVPRRWWLLAGILVISGVAAWVLVNLVFGVPPAGIVATVW